MKDKFTINFSEKFISTLSLFTSISTLFCCALPTLLVTLGLGATMVSLTSTFPALIWLGEHKVQLFIFSFIMLFVSSILFYSQRNVPCPIDPKRRDACIRGRKWSRIVLILSWSFLSTGFFFAFLAESIFY